MKLANANVITEFGITWGQIDRVQINSYYSNICS